MEYYLAPLEGITNYIYRQCYDKYFDGVSKCFIPFLSPVLGELSKHDLKEVSIDKNNLKIKVVPQIISKDAKDTINVISYLKSLGYDEINLNFGCPSPTVTKKNKGAGMLDNLIELDSYLSEVFKIKDMKISIKTRLALNDENMFNKIIEIYNKYPISELIIHPRVASDLYNKPLRLDFLDKVINKIKAPIVFNGEIKTLVDVDKTINRYPKIKAVMIGRGLIANPDLLNVKDNNVVKDFYYELKNTYLNEYGFNNTVYFLKEIWSLLINRFEIDEKTKKALFKFKNEKELNEIEKKIFN